LKKYKIYNIYSRDEIEQLGTKEKFWFYDSDGLKKLFKVGRPNTGENWSEKVAFELAKLLNIPCARYEFAKWNEKLGTISTSFTDDYLIHANEILASYDESYQKNSTYHAKDYKLERVLYLVDKLLDSLDLPTDNIVKNEIKKPIDLFIGYLVFDFWIANLDRHHENWGIILGTNQLKFAPTYDHAAGLGSKVSKEEAQKRLTTKDKNYTIKKFVTKAKSPFYSEDAKQLKSIEVVEILVTKYPKSTCYWIDKIATLKKEKFNEILEAVPDIFMDRVQKSFVLGLLDENKKRLVDMKEVYCNE
jgi:hypothetical protein